MTYSKHILLFSAVCVLALLNIACSNKVEAIQQKEQRTSDLKFTSSNQVLQESFRWAKEMALSFVEDEAPVGPWYEAALPGREAFCMRDVAHQCLAAEMLGLSNHNKNMFLKFAENISESKDYCSFWEINRHNKPAPVDYESDEDFWYNLPANFDIIKSMWILYQWTADSFYISNNSMLRFVNLSLDEYVDRWALNAGEILERDRHLNTEKQQLLASQRFYKRRGIPTYNEGGRGETQLGIDLTASMIAAYSAGAQIAFENGNQGLEEKYLKDRKDHQALLESFWWQSKSEEYKTIIYDNNESDLFMVGDNQAFSHYLLYFDAINDPERKKKIILQYIVNEDKLIVELLSHLPTFYYQAGFIHEGHNLVEKLSGQQNKRRTYPEVSFSIIGDIVSSYMGIDVKANKKTIITHPHFLEGEQSRIEGLPALDGSISFEVHKDGRYSLTNNTSQLLNWNPRFSVNAVSLMINGVSLNAIYAKDTFDALYVYQYCRVKPGQTVTVKPVLK